MSPDDPRHGTYAGHVAGCRDRCCGAAKLAYDKRRKYDAHRGIGRKVESWRAVRRVQALQRLGWSVPRIAAVAGLYHQQVYDLDRYPTCYRATFDAIERTYAELSMRLPRPDTTGERISVTRARRHAERMGWLPPLTWDDIDDADERPHTGRELHHYLAAELVAEWRWLESAGESIDQAARQLGVTVGAIEKAIERAGKVSAA